MLGMICCPIYQVAIWALILAIGGICVGSYKGYDPFEDQAASSLSGVYDMARDWDR